MKKLLILLTLAFTINVNAQDDKTVTLVVSGQGKTQDEAKQNALRSAIEQAFGTFISSKTEILNDNLVKDEIVSVSNGNIQKYDVISAVQIPDGGYATTLKATVSVSKLTSFCESKGISIEFKGNLFAMNIKQQILNEESEAKAICNIVCVAQEFLQNSFDYEITSGNPSSLDGTNSQWGIPINIKAKTNKNFALCAKYLMENLSIFGLSIEELQNYKSLNKKVFPFTLVRNQGKITFWFRNKSSAENLGYLLTDYESYVRGFVINSGIQITEGNESVFYKIGKINNLIDIKDLNNEGMIFNFIESENPIATFSWVDNKTTEEIEKLTGYTIKSNENKFKYQCNENNEYNNVSLIQNNKTLKDAQFPGGIAELGRFIQKNLQYPLMAREKGLSGKCFLAVEVRADGQIGKIKVINPVIGCIECNREAIRIINLMPRWEPGLDLNGMPVSTFFKFPISFKIQ
jgi:hypothetical protein